MVVKILLVDDHPVFRAGLRALLDTAKDVIIVGEAANGIEAIEQVKKHQPDLVVMDISMPDLNGIEATKEILSIAPEVKVLALSIHAGKQFVKDMLNAGAKGYLLKDSVPDELISAIDKLLKGEMFLSPTITKVALEKDKDTEEAKPEILFTKLHRPPITEDTIIRTNLIDELESNLHKPLSLFCAPAGYGKSTLASQWLEKTKALYSWVSLDNEHNDLRIFLLYVCTSIEKIFPGMLEKTLKLLDLSETPPLNIITKSLINEMDQIEQEFILVLDDYHHIKNDNINLLIDNMLRFPPENMHLALITRRDPPLKLHALRSHNRITEVRMQELAFNQQEIISLYHKLMLLDLDQKTAQVLLEKTEGWVVGLRLASMGIKNQEDLNVSLHNLKGDIHLVSEFLMEEVLTNLPVDISKVLLNSSILDRFSPKLLDVLIAQSENSSISPLTGEKIIQYLIKANLFIIPLNEQYTWFRLHHLFKELLQKKLIENSQKENIYKLHSLVSDWFENNGFITESIHHATEAQNFDRVKEIIEQNWISALNKDHWFMVGQWLPSVPENLIDSSLSLSLLKAHVYYHKNMLTKIPPILEHIKQINKTPNNFESGLIAWFGSIFSFIGGQGEESIKYSEEVLRLYPKEYHRFRSDQETWLVLALHLSGKSDLAFQRTDEAIRSMESPGEPIQLSRYIAQKAFLNLLNVNFEKLKLNVQDFTKIKNLNPYTQTFLDYLQASIKWWRNNPDDVTIEFDPVIENQYHVEAQLGMDAYIAKSLALEELKRSDEANSLMEEALKQVEDRGIEENIAVIKTGFARLALLQEDVASAENWISTVHNPGINPFNLFWIEIPAITICRVLIARGSSSGLNQALELLSDYRAKFESWNNKLRTAEIATLQAAARYKMGDKDNALKDLRHAIEITSQSKLLQPFVELGDQIFELLSMLIDQRFEVDFVQKIHMLITTKKQVKAGVKASSSNTDLTSNQNRLQTDLSQREMEILVHVSQGLRNKEVADKLYVSTDTIKKHLYNTFQKLDVNNRLELVNKAKELGLLEV